MGVNHLDTKYFNSIINAYSAHITAFEDIVIDVNNTVNTITSNWVGKGRNAFATDSTQVQMNLRDITGIMYELRDALINAHAEYMQADNATAKSIES